MIPVFKKSVPRHSCTNLFSATDLKYLIYFKYLIEQTNWLSYHSNYKGNRLRISVNYNKIPESWF